MPARHYNLPDIEYGTVHAHPDRGDHSRYKIVARPDINEWVELGRAEKRRSGFAAYRVDGAFVPEEFKKLQAVCERLWQIHEINVKHAERCKHATEDNNQPDDAWPMLLFGSYGTMCGPWPDVERHLTENGYTSGYAGNPNGATGTRLRVGYRRRGCRDRRLSRMRPNRRPVRGVRQPGGRLRGRRRDLPILRPRKHVLMSGFRFWLVACDALEPDGSDCPVESDDARWTLGEARVSAREDGWLVAIPGARGQQRDLCPKHRNDDRDSRHYAGQKPVTEAPADG